MSNRSVRYAKIEYLATNSGAKLDKKAVNE